MNLGTDAAPSLGVSFNGYSESGSNLYMNFITGLANAAPGEVHYCTAAGCSFFNTIGVNL